MAHMGCGPEGMAVLNRRRLPPVDLAPLVQAVTVERLFGLGGLNQALEILGLTDVVFLEILPKVPTPIS